ncbi:MAG: hypothetical protein IT289_11100 [Oligoflexia bacterium]|nr:hypothetical protein [Oligoflexia bacterium]
MAILNCYSCGKDAGIGEKVGRGDVCQFCRIDVRVCRNCQFYDPRAYNECKEPAADRVVDKEKANFCDFFQPRQGPVSAAMKADPKFAAEALFKKGKPQ